MLVGAGTTVWGAPALHTLYFGGAGRGVGTTVFWGRHRERSGYRRDDSHKH